MYYTRLLRIFLLTVVLSSCNQKHKTSNIVHKKTHFSNSIGSVKQENKISPFKYAITSITSVVSHVYSSVSNLLYTTSSSVKATTNSTPKPNTNLVNKESECSNKSKESTSIFSKFIGLFKPAKSFISSFRSLSGGNLR